jgi:hypothetical protein
MTTIFDLRNQLQFRTFRPLEILRCYFAGVCVNFLG